MVEPWMKAAEYFILQLKEMAKSSPKMSNTLHLLNTQTLELWPLQISVKDEVISRVIFFKKFDFDFMIYFLGISSGLGLISIDAIEAFKVDEPYVIAIEKEANGKYYLAQFKILI